MAVSTLSATFSRSVFYSRHAAVVASFLRRITAKGLHAMENRHSDVGSVTHGGFQRRHANHHFV